MISILKIFALLSIVICTAGAQTAQPNVLLIIADDLGIDGLEGFGVQIPNFPTTPNISALKADGVTYMNTWSSPVCAPTRAGIMSGKYGIKTGVMTVPGNLGLEHESIFNYLKRDLNDQYATALIGKWHLSNPTNLDHPQEHGVDHFEGIMGGAVGDYYSWQKTTNGQQERVTEYATTHLTDAATDWIGQQTQQWFLWLAHFAPHSPFQVPPDGTFSVNDPTSDRQIYNASIEALDYNIGRLLDEMDQQTRENTVIIFIGDNGTPNSVLSGFPSRHGKGSLFEGGLRVPMVISGAGVTRKGEEEIGLTQTADLHATIIELCSGDLPGGIYNSYSIKESLTNENTITRPYIYSDSSNDDELRWAIRNNEHKLIADNQGNRALYDLTANIDEENDLLISAGAAEMEILELLETEAEVIRTDWSCQDQILNGNEQTIDDCEASSDCPEVDILSMENIGCCDTPDVPSVYYEYLENNLRNIYSNGFPNHDYCYNPNNIPEQSYNHFRIAKEPVVTNRITSITRNNGRPARHFGVALNGVSFSPAPGTPFIYTNKNTGEFNWDWVFEPTTNQGNEMGRVRLDCATAHTNASGYHYHGEMYQYLETEEPGITSLSTMQEPYQIGWASDGHPIVYRFGPDASGTMKDLKPSYTLKSGERPGDGIVAPCGPYTGKYTVDFEYVEGLGDLDECNGIESTITLETALGTETFEYFYVVTSEFPQISRCLKGEPSQDFENGEDPLTGIDADGDGYLSQFDCDDNNVLINPSAEEIPNNGIDEDCDGSDLMTSIHELSASVVNIFPNPATKEINIKVTGTLNYSAIIFSYDGKLIQSQINSSRLEIGALQDGNYILEIQDLDTGEKVVEPIVIKK